MSDTADLLIISTQRFQSELLAHYLHREIGVLCRIAPPSDLDARIGEDKAEPVVILWDCTGKTPDAIWSGLGNRIPSRSGNRFTALLNVGKDDHIEFEAIRRGVRGVFFENIDTGLLARGIEAIVNGELWYSRECIVAFLMGEHRPEPLPAPDDVPLTRRENHILLKVASGLPSSQIADELFISTNTVKTHIRNIYKKLNVTNRFEAARWVSRNI